MPSLVDLRSVVAAVASVEHAGRLDVVADIVGVVVVRIVELAGLVSAFAIVNVVAVVGHIVRLVPSGVRLVSSPSWSVRLGGIVAAVAVVGVVDLANNAYVEAQLAVASSLDRHRKLGERPANCEGATN